MKIVILTIDSVYSNRIVKDLLGKYGDRIQLIVEPKSLFPGKSNFQTILKYLKISGFYYVVNQIIKLEIYKIVSEIYSILGCNVNNKFYRKECIAGRLGVKMKYFFRFWDYLFTN